TPVSLVLLLGAIVRGCGGPGAHAFPPVLDVALRFLRGSGRKVRQFPRLPVDDRLPSLAAGAAKEEAGFPGRLSRTLDEWARRGAGRNEVRPERQTAPGDVCVYAGALRQSGPENRTTTR